MREITITPSFINKGMIIIKIGDDIKEVTKEELIALETKIWVYVSSQVPL